MHGIDLRPRDFIIKNQFFLPRVVLTVGIIIYILIVLILGITLRFLQLENNLQLRVLEEEYRLALMMNGEKKEDYDVLRQEPDFFNKGERGSGFSAQLQECLQIIFMHPPENTENNSQVMLQNFKDDFRNSIEILAVKSVKDRRLTVTAAVEEPAAALRYLLYVREAEGCNLLHYKEQGREENRYIFQFDVEFND